MTTITAIVPTVTGREESLDRCLTALRTRSKGAKVEILTALDAPCCGIAWQKLAKKATGDILHFTADDLEVHEGWWQPLVEACEKNLLPAPVVLNPNGTVQSAGGDLAASNCLLTTVRDDWAEVPFTPVPTLTRKQWDKIGTLPIHYFTDVWVSYRGRQLGIETVLRTGSVITHHNEAAGRGAGMSQGQRVQGDSQVFWTAINAVEGT